MSWIGAFLALVLVELGGLAVLALACREPGRFSVAGRLGLAFGLGLVALTLGLFGFSASGVVPAPWVGGTVVALLAAAAVRVRGVRACRRLLAGSGDEPLGPVGAASAALILVLCASVGVASLLEPVVEWDVLAIWALKGKILLHEPVRASAYFQDATKAYSHPDYPLLWPFALAWTWCGARTEDLQTIKLLAPALQAATLAAAYGLFRRFTTRPLAVLLTAVVAGSPMLASQTSRLLADPALALFVLAAFGCAALWLESDHRDDLRLAGLFAAGMLFTKNEGMGLHAVLVAAIAALRIARGQRRLHAPALGWLVGVPLGLTAGWFLFRWGIPKLHEDYGSRIHPAAFVENASRIPAVLDGWFRHATAFADWHAFWPLLAVVVVLSARRWSGGAAAFLVGSLVAGLGMYAGVHVVSPWEVRALMEATTARLLLHLFPLGVLALAACAREAGWLPRITAPVRTSSTRAGTPGIRGGGLPRRRGFR